MNQNNKAIFAVILLIIAGGLFAWHYSHREKVVVLAPDAAIKNEGVQLLEDVFSKVGSKKWSDASLWLTPNAAQAYGPVAEKIFSASPSMEGIKVLDYGTDVENNNATFLILQVPNSEMCINVSFNKNKAGKMVLDNVVETRIRAQDFKKF